MGGNHQRECAKAQPRQDLSARVSQRGLNLVSPPPLPFSLVGGSRTHGGRPRGGVGLKPHAKPCDHRFSGSADGCGAGDVPIRRPYVQPRRHVGSADNVLAATGLVRAPSVARASSPARVGLCDAEKSTESPSLRVGGVEARCRLLRRYVSR